MDLYALDSVRIEEVQRRRREQGADNVEYHKNITALTENDLIGYDYFCSLQ